MMYRSLPYLVLNSLIGVGLAYLVNQLPTIPSSLKPWVWLLIVGFVLLATFVASRLQSNSQVPQRSQSVLSNIKGYNIRAKDISAQNTLGEVKDQQIASNLEAQKDIDLGNISVKQ
ncbi:hypothetical protein IQ266_04080 [filamentous cyanobacterium LEGE 11480]|uniref:Uncharacterized protein n=1 Tax=Romeriopsis navalis LEGE 11480 TaxID=2777977 RepID=A0A928Z338_9CYAN|nr:hypothetical protein [Romeriopsis navalis]MBE9028940.1 hypothetical protein [Romeriopsis navalis LEGE 11480]